jgi:hypothetical protein
MATAGVLLAGAVKQWGGLTGLRRLSANSTFIPARPAFTRSREMGAGDAQKPLKPDTRGTLDTEGPNCHETMGRENSNNHNPSLR